MKPCVVEFDPGKLHTLLISRHLPGNGPVGCPIAVVWTEGLLTSARQPVTAKEVIMTHVSTTTAAVGTP